MGILRTGIATLDIQGNNLIYSKELDHPRLFLPPLPPPPSSALRNRLLTEKRISEENALRPSPLWRTKKRTFQWASGGGKRQSLLASPLTKGNYEFIIALHLGRRGARRRCFARNSLLGAGARGCGQARAAASPPACPLRTPLGRTR